MKVKLLFYSLHIYDPRNQIMTLALIKIFGCLAAPKKTLSSTLPNNAFICELTSLSCSCPDLKVDSFGQLMFSHLIPHLLPYILPDNILGMVPANLSAADNRITF